VRQLACFLGGFLWAQGYYLLRERQFFVGGAGEQFATVAISDEGGQVFIGGYALPTKESLPEGWIAAITSAGEVVWQLTPGGMGPDRIEDLYVQDSVVYFCGSSGSALGHPEELPVERRADFWVGAVEKHTGRLLWQKRWGSPYIDMALSVCATPYRTLLVAGVSWEDPTEGMQAVIQVLQAQTGEVLQVRRWGKAPSLLRRIRPLPSTSYYVCIGEESYKPFVAGVDYLGQVYWRTVFQFHRFPSQLFALLPTSAGQIVVGGRYGDRWGVSMLDMQGRVVWEKVWDHSPLKGKVLGLAMGVDRTIYGVGVQYGYELSLAEQRGGEDVWLAALTPEGRLLWERGFGGPQDEYGIAFLPLSGKEWLLVANKENRFGDSLAGKDAWSVKFWAVPCDSLPLRGRTDALSGREKAGQPIRFWIEGGGAFPIEKVVWDLGNGITIEGQEITHIYGEPGFYVVQPILNLRYGCKEVYLPPIALRITRP